LRRGVWGNGYATEAAGRVIEHARQLRALDEVIAEIAPANRASMRVAEKLGMKSRGFAELPGGLALRYAARTDAGSTRAPDTRI
jgi:RimJ/RimL family protein N-acetyltransferase